MGKIITREINKKIKQLVYTPDPINWELALMILKGLPGLKEDAAEQKMLQLLRSYHHTSTSGVRAKVFREFINDNIFNDKLKNLYTNVFGGYSMIFSGKNRYNGMSIIGMTEAKGRVKIINKGVYKWKLT